MNKPFIIGTIAGVLLALTLVGLFLSQRSQPAWPPEDVVRESGTGGWVYVNRLTILGSGQDVEEIVKEFDEKVIFSIPETTTYEVEFPVSSLNELGQIKGQLEQRGIQAIFSAVLQPPDCRRGPC